MLSKEKENTTIGQLTFQGCRFELSSVLCCRFVVRSLWLQWNSVPQATSWFSISVPISYQEPTNRIQNISKIHFRFQVRKQRGIFDTTLQRSKILDQYRRCSLHNLPVRRMCRRYCLRIVRICLLLLILILQDHM